MNRSSERYAKMGDTAERAAPVFQGQETAVTFGDLPAEDQADPGALALGGEERNEQVRGIRQPARRPPPTRRGRHSYAATRREEARRTREIGIRMALGANARDVVRSVTRSRLVMSVAGVALGLVAAAGLTRFVGGLLYDVRPFDPFTYGLLAAFLLAVASLAAYVPARRATRVNPVEVLRDEG